MNFDDECKRCAWMIGGRCTNKDAYADIGDCGHYDGCGGWSLKEEKEEKK